MFGLRASDCLSEDRRLMVVRLALCRRTSVAVAGRTKSSTNTTAIQIQIQFIELLARSLKIKKLKLNK